MNTLEPLHQHANKDLILQEEHLVYVFSKHTLGNSLRNAETQCYLTFMLIFVHENFIFRLGAEVTLGEKK